MEPTINSLPSEEWLEQQAAIAPEAEHAEALKAIKGRIEMGKQNEAEMRDVLSTLNLKPSDIEEKDREAAETSEVQATEIEAKLAGQGPENDNEAARLVTVESNLSAQSVTGTGPGNYYDFSPYSCWHRWYTHREGGAVEGRVACSLPAHRMHSYSYARGDGAGFWNDNYTTSWTKMYFAFWPRRVGHVRAYVPYQLRGFYDIYANDRWFNDKSATIDVDVSMRLHQNAWGGYVKDNAFRKQADNINQNGRLDTNRTLYTGGIAVGADKWVIAEIAVKNYVHAQGGGSRAKMSFWSPDRIYLPYVRFDFS